MATVLVTGSADGIGRRTAELLVRGGHRVVLHARNEQRATVAKAAVPDAADVLIGDLTSIGQTLELARTARDAGPFDAVVHNAGVAYSGSRRRELTEDGLERTFHVNVLAPYLLTALIPLPQRLIYLTSGMADGGVIDLTDLQYERRRWDGTGAYCDSKLADIALSLIVALRYPQVYSNAVCPGWVRSRMGGPGAPTDLTTGAATQVWLATSNEPAARVSAQYFRHLRRIPDLAGARDVATQEGLLDACAGYTGVHMPA